MAITKAQELTWLLAEMNFRCEVLALDDKISREHNVRDCMACFVGEVLDPPISKSQHGLAATDPQERLPHLLGFATIMKKWAARRPCPNVIACAHDVRTWSLTKIEELERLVALHYTQCFYDHFGRAAVVPLRLEHDVRPVEASEHAGGHSEVEDGEIADVDMATAGTRHIGDIAQGAGDASRDVDMLTVDDTAVVGQVVDESETADTRDSAHAHNSSETAEGQGDVSRDVQMCAVDDMADQDGGDTSQPQTPAPETRWPVTEDHGESARTSEALTGPTTGAGSAVEQAGQDDPFDYSDDDMPLQLPPHKPDANVDWRQPPQVAAVSTHIRWMDWEYNNIDKEFTPITRDAAQQLPDSSRTWYCRRYCRRLHLEDYVPAPDIWDVKNFGAPTPEGEFKLGLANVPDASRSEWMYVEEKPSRAFPAGTVAKLPQNRQGP
ncbi:hypothetical protein GGX14DRAFT_571808 [Mycena pura]|uniref:Uncharacterized protein n=1 Tax=Mycena pura TaxID=153505 RepID=A0AAD6V230_9AGAR|nr:hypothetical protein GGX14DRAFT_571808 [Mycena pura]